MNDLGNRILTTPVTHIAVLQLTKRIGSDLEDYLGTAFLYLLDWPVAVFILGRLLVLGQRGSGTDAGGSQKESCKANLVENHCSGRTHV